MCDVYGIKKWSKVPGVVRLKKPYKCHFCFLHLSSRSLSQHSFVASPALRSSCVFHIIRKHDFLLVASFNVKIQM